MNLRIRKLIESPNPRERVIEILLVREVLEGFAARLAMAHIDERTVEQMKSLFRIFLKRTSEIDPKGIPKPI